MDWSSADNHCTWGAQLWSSRNVKIPDSGKIYSFNEGNYNMWDAETKAYIDHIKVRGPRGLG